ncbi:hypothetical protein AB4Y45_24715 [Paraburkholderia sp. EG287A]|uniref:hypothetical protein n=1 Tax=unclassified Paraburkholderia TaxID=2615204 RepID=UPI0034D22541
MSETTQFGDDWARTCRRLFLRGCKAVTYAGPAGRPVVNVEIWVSYENSTSPDDELADVVDYSVMRDALLQADTSTVGRFISTVLDDLANWPVRRARIEVIDEESGNLIGEGERMTQQ